MLKELINQITDTAKNGRKFRLFAISLGAGLLCYVGTCLCPAMANNLSAILMFITGLYTAFCSGNVAATWVHKQSIDSEDKEEEPLANGTK